MDGATFDELWKRVHTQSERQFGAYQFVYGLEEGELPEVLTNSKVNFRNKVIHQGRIPTRQEAISYGQCVANVVNPALKLLLSGKPELLRQIELDHLYSGGKDVEAGTAVSTYSMMTLLKWSRPTSEKTPTVQDWLVHTESMRNRMSGMQI